MFRVLRGGGFEVDDDALFFYFFFFLFFFLVFLFFKLNNLLGASCVFCFVFALYVLAFLKMYN